MSFRGAVTGDFARRNLCGRLPAQASPGDHAGVCWQELTVPCFSIRIVGFLVESSARRGGRAAECTGLENRQPARVRGFKSHPLRLKDKRPCDMTCRRAFLLNLLLPLGHSGDCSNCDVYHCDLSPGDLAGRRSAGWLGRWIGFLSTCDAHGPSPTPLGPLRFLSSPRVCLRLLPDC